MSNDSNDPVFKGKVHKCLHCDKRCVLVGFKFCPDCGERIIWLDVEVNHKDS